MKNINVYKPYGELHRTGLDFVFTKMDEISGPAKTDAVQADLIGHGLTYVAEFCCNTLFDKKRLSAKYFHLLDQALTIEDDVPPDPVDTPHDHFTRRKALIYILRMIDAVTDFREENIQAFERRYAEYVNNSYVPLPGYFFIAAENVKAQAGFHLTRSLITDQSKTLLNEIAIVSVANEQPDNPEKVVVAALATGVSSIIAAEFKTRSAL